MTLKTQTDELRRKAEERLEALLIAGLQSEETELTRADWQEIRKEAVAQGSRARSLANGRRNIPDVLDDL